MAIRKFMVTTKGGVVSQLRDNTKYQFLQDENGTVYIPLVQYDEAPAGGGDDEEDEKPAAKKDEKAGKGSKKAAEKSAPAKEAVPAKGGKETKAVDKGKKVDEVTRILTDLDSAEMTEDKAVKKLVELLKADRKKVQKIVTAMLDDEDAEIAAVAKKLKALAAAEEVEEEDEDVDDEDTDDEDADTEDSDDEEEDDDDEDEDEEEAKPAKGGKKKGIDPKSLKKGDKVSVYWGTNPKTEEEYDDEFEGKVVKVADGKISIHYSDDDETLTFDPKWQEIRSKG